LPPPPESEAEEAPATEPEADPSEVRPPRSVGPVPLPDPIVVPQDNRPTIVEDEDAADQPVPEIQYDISTLPEPVRHLREQIMAACLSGDIERLRSLLVAGQDGTQISFGAVPSDPIEFLRSISGDGEGHEILAILYEVLAAGFVLEEIEGEKMYIWPYFYAVPLATLTPSQRVELFKLVTAGDYEDMKNFGGYIFYRVGITPEGRWQFFVAGD
jgi:hypothetical protein